MGEALFTLRGSFLPPGFLLLAVLSPTGTFVFRAAFFEVGFVFAMGFFVPLGFFFGMRKSLTLVYPANNTPQIQDRLQHQYLMPERNDLTRFPLQERSILDAIPTWADCAAAENHPPRMGDVSDHAAHACQLSRQAGIDPKLVADQFGHGLGVNLYVYTVAALHKRQDAVEVLESAPARRGSD